jgi:anaerobic glycerol-3-phosphate dehydrogenase
MGRARSKRCRYEELSPLSKNPTLAARALRVRVDRKLAARTRRQQLARELATYSSHADRSELDAIIGRHSADEIREIEQILVTQATRQSRKRRLR